jgi:hypothetical protein
MWLGVLLCCQKVLLSNIGIKSNFEGNEQEYEQSRDRKCQVLCTEKDTLELELEGTSNIYQTFCDQHTPSKHKVKVKSSRNRPGVAQRVPGGLGSQIFMTFGT